MELNMESLKKFWSLLCVILFSNYEKITKMVWKKIKDFLFIGPCTITDLNEIQVH